MQCLKKKSTYFNIQKQFLNMKNSYELIIKKLSTIKALSKHMKHRHRQNRS